MKKPADQAAKATAQVATVGQDVRSGCHRMDLGIVLVYFVGLKNRSDEESNSGPSPM